MFFYFQTMPLILANAGLPMMFLFTQVFLMACVFIPVVLIETGVLWRPVERSFRKTLPDVALANLWTTLLGVPLAWLITYLLEKLTLGGPNPSMTTPVEMIVAVMQQAEWLAPDNKHWGWMFPCASTVLLIPCFIISVALEGRALSLCWQNQERRKIYFAVLRANAWSYLFLLIAGICWTFARIK